MSVGCSLFRGFNVGIVVQMVGSQRVNQQNGNASIQKWSNIEAHIGKYSVITQSMTIPSSITLPVATTAKHSGSVQRNCEKRCNRPDYLGTLAEMRRLHEATALL